MSAVEIVAPDGLAPPRGHYVHATAARGLLFISGQLPFDDQGSPMSSASITDQFCRCMANIEHVLKARKSDLGDLVKLNIYLSHIDHWPEANEACAQYLGEIKTARAIIPTSKLHYGVDVEVDAVALDRQVDR